jgi:O-antigen biosynthesis protein
LTYEKDNNFEKELNLITSPQAVTGACVFVETTKFWEIGGFTEEYLITWQDIDLCLKLEERFNETLCVPYVKLFHHESGTRKLYPTEKEVHDLELFRETWKS